jgi:hypothetical protein
VLIKTASGAFGSQDTVRCSGRTCSAMSATVANSGELADHLHNAAERAGGLSLFAPVGVAHGDALGSECSPDGAAIDTEPLADASH